MPVGGWKSAAMPGGGVGEGALFVVGARGHCNFARVRVRVRIRVGLAKP